MHTSGFRSAVPPNHAATRPDLVSAIVEAWQEGNGAVSKMNSDLSTGLEVAAVAQPVRIMVAARTSARPRRGMNLENIQLPMSDAIGDRLDVGRWIFDVGCFL